MTFYEHAVIYPANETVIKF